MMRMCAGTFMIVMAAFAAGGCMDGSGDPGANPEGDLGSVQSELQEVRNGPTFGGSGGNNFYPLVWHVGQRISKVKVWWGNEVDGISVFYLNWDGSEDEEHYGGWGGDHKGDTFEIFTNDGEELWAIFGTTGSRVDSVNFITSWGRYSPHYGGWGGSRSYYSDPTQAPRPGMKLGGLFGKGNVTIDRIGEVWYLP